MEVFDKAWHCDTRDSINRSSTSSVYETLKALRDLGRNPQVQRRGSSELHSSIHRRTDRCTELSED